MMYCGELESGCVGAPTLRAVMRSGVLEGGYVGAPTSIIVITTTPLLLYFLNTTVRISRKLLFS